MFAYINPIKILAAIAFLYSFTLAGRHFVNHRLISVILFLCFTTEVVNSFLILYGLPNAAIMTVSMTIHNALWLVLLAHNLPHKRLIQFAIVAFLAFAISNAFFFQGPMRFNYYTFVVGGFFYIAIFIFESFVQLRKENFDFFFSNAYLLLFAPIFLFFGVSFMFGFDSREVTSAHIFPHIKLYDFIIYFVNIIYYSLILLYIRREKQPGLCSIK